MKREWLLLVLILTWGQSWAESRPFTDNSLPEIERAHSGHPFLLVVWSLYCPPCFHELALLSEWSNEHPEVGLVLLSADPLQAGAVVDETLQQLGLGDLESWISADEIPERFRYRLDPQWRGELPRSYFYSARGRRVAHSGLLSREMLESWRLDTSPGPGSL